MINTNVTAAAQSTSALPSQTSQPQKDCRAELYRLWREKPIPDEQLLVNLGLYIRSSALAKLFFLQEIYLQILDIPGCVITLGTWWGQDIIVFESLRAIYEPYNYARRIIGFDTFTGYPSPSKNDKPSTIISTGNYSTPENYEKYLEALLNYHESENAMSHVKKHEVIKGDVTTTAVEFFARNPETLVALAYFDMALYEPTKAALEAILPRLVKGSILAFDELNSRICPGETKAILETIDLKTSTIKCSKVLPDRSYLIIG